MGRRRLHTNSAIPPPKAVCAGLELNLGRSQFPSPVSHVAHNFGLRDPLEFAESHTLTTQAQEFTGIEEFRWRQLRRQFRCSAINAWLPCERLKMRWANEFGVLDVATSYLWNRTHQNRQMHPTNGHLRKSPL